MFMTKRKGPIQPNQFAKKCVIMHLPTQKLMKYDEESETLYYDPKGFTVFESKQRAISARHHGIETLRGAGVEENWKEYFQVIET